jgi:hypothetical protein
MMGGNYDEAVGLGSGAMIYIIKFHTDWLRHSKVNGMEYRHTHAAE